MRRYYIDNIRWGTVLLVELYHVIYMFNGVVTYGVIGSFSAVQYQNADFEHAHCLLDGKDGMVSKYGAIHYDEDSDIAFFHHLMVDEKR